MFARTSAGSAACTAASAPPIWSAANGPASMQDVRAAALVAADAADAACGGSTRISSGLTWRVNRSGSRSPPARTPTTSSSQPWVHV